MIRSMLHTFQKGCVCRGLGVNCINRPFLNVFHGLDGTTEGGGKLFISDRSRTGSGELNRMTFSIKMFSFSDAVTQTITCFTVNLFHKSSFLLFSFSLLEKSCFKSRAKYFCTENSYERWKREMRAHWEIKEEEKNTQLNNEPRKWLLLLHLRHRQTLMIASSNFSFVGGFHRQQENTWHELKESRPYSIANGGLPLSLYLHFFLPILVSYLFIF